MKIDDQNAGTSAKLGISFPCLRNTLKEEKNNYEFGTMNLQVIFCGSFMRKLGKDFRNKINCKEIRSNIHSTLNTRSLINY